MRADRYTRHGFTLAATAALLTMTAYASATAATPASLQRPAGTAAAAPGWRVVKTIGPAKGSVSGLLTAGSATDAWSIWTAQGLTVVERWTGKAWQRVPLPAKLDGYVNSAAATGFMSASSAGNLWLFDGSGKALRWTGTKWLVQALPSWVSRPTGAAAFSPGDVWVFGTTAYAARYNGRTWAKVKLPEPAADVSAAGPDDIWALGPSLGFVMHWNGTNWATVRVPLPPLPSGATLSYSDITAVGPQDAWLVQTITLSSSPVPDTAMLHWNGRAWLTVVSPVDFAGSLVPDGHGGLWVAGIDLNPSGFWLVYHLTGGHWTDYGTLPGVIPQAQPYLTWIPGTRSLWAADQELNAASPGSYYGAILKYGP